MVCLHVILRVSQMSWWRPWFVLRFVSECSCFGLQLTGSHLRSSQPILQLHTMHIALL